MSDKLFNTPFEMGLRVTLLMSVASKELFSIERIVALDFISCYAADFSLPYANLHGNTRYKYGEIANRRILVQETVKDLVLRGIIEVTVDGGYQYSISSLGGKFAKKFKSAYAKEYIVVAKAAIKKYRKCSDKEILDLIQEFSVKALRG